MFDSNIDIDASVIPSSTDAHPATTIGVEEVDRNESWDSETDWYTTKKYETYKRLSTLNEGQLVVPGRWNGPYNTQVLNRETVKSIATQLGLTASQQRKATAYYLAFDLERWGIRADVVAFALCQYLVHSDPSDKRECHPKSDSVPDEFEDVQDSITIPERMLSKTYGKIQHKLNNEEIYYDEMDEPFRQHLRGEGGGWVY
jgi:hypothetical protein